VSVRSRSSVTSGILTFSPPAPPPENYKPIIWRIYTLPFHWS
jgi:hypothetical protein